jgi:urea transport system ATP-binding protein
MLKVRDIKVNYGKSKIINGMSFDIHTGDKLVIIGRNGVGKTTLLKSVVGLLPLVQGSIDFFDQDISTTSTHDRSRLGIAYVPQGREIIPYLTVEENLELGGYAHRNNSDDLKQKVLTYFPALREHLKRKGGVLSGGQQQQLAIGRALMSSPKILLLDEPTEGIQPNIVAEIANILNRIREEMSITIVIVEQNLKFALKIAEKFIVIQKGEIVVQGKTNELSQEIINSYLTI